MNSIAINGVSVTTGGGITFLKNLCISLPEVSIHRYVVIIPYDFDEKSLIRSESCSQMEFYKIPKYTRFVPIRILWEQFVLPMILKKQLKVDCVICLANIGLRLFCNRQLLVIQSIAPYLAEGMAGKGYRQQFRYWLLRLLTKQSFQKSYKIVALSNCTKKLLLTKKFPNKKIISIPLGVPDFFYLKGRCLSKKMPKENYLLCVSSLSRHKNFGVVIKALGKLKNIGCNYTLKIAGAIVDKIYHRELCDLAESYNVKQNVLFLGNVKYDELPELYYNAKAFILPSLVENFPHTLVEAMASGSVIISSNSIPTKEICGNAAVLFNPKEYESLVESIQIISCKIELTTILRSQALKKSLSYSWNKVAKIYSKEIDAVLEITC
jgi:glycosyltransferase involved in cell wall biosynthesis